MDVMRRRTKIVIRVCVGCLVGAPFLAPFFLGGPPLRTVATGPSKSPVKATAAPSISSSLYLGADHPLLSTEPKLEPEPVKPLPQDVALALIGAQEDSPSLTTAYDAGGDQFGGAGMVWAGAVGGVPGVSNSTGFLHLAPLASSPAALVQFPDISRSYPEERMALGGGGGGASSSPGRGSPDSFPWGEGFTFVASSRPTPGPAMHPGYRPPLAPSPIPEPASVALLAIGLLVPIRCRR